MMPTFYGAKHSNGDLVVIRKDSLNGEKPEKALGAHEVYRLEAPDSERARSMLAAKRAAARK